MTTPADSDVPPLPTRRLIDQRCDAFEAAWQAGHNPRLEHYLSPISGATQSQLLRELLIIELAYRHPATSSEVAGEELLSRHPALRSQLVSELCHLAALGAQAAKPVSPSSEPTIRDSGGAPISPNPESGDEAGLHIRCPHCQNAVELLADAPLEEISCISCGSTFSLIPPENDSTALARQRIARFELIERLGVGGFGTVWKARDTELDRMIALKIPRKGHLSPRETEQFLREARAAAQIKHPHIVPVHEVGRDGDTIFIVTDLIHGVSLAEWMRAESLSPREAAQLCATIAGALDFAHRQGVIHRDLKPSNVMIDQGEQPHIMDFGLAKRELGEVTMTLDGQILGTPAYMSPEQAQGQTHWTDRRTDIYSLGVMLFQLLTRELPFRGTVQQQIRQRIEDDAPDPRRVNAFVPADLATLCLKCLERDPNRRYTFAWEVADELQRYLRGEPILARPISIPERAWRWATRNPALATASLLTVAAAIAGPVVAWRIHQLNVDLNNRIAGQRTQIKDDNERIDALEKQVATRDSTLQARSAAGVTPDWRLPVIKNLLEQHASDLQADLADPDQSPRQQARTHLGLALLWAELKRQRTALEHFEQAAQLLEQLLTAAPATTDLQTTLAHCYLRIAQLQAQLGDAAAAEVAARNALKRQATLARSQPETTEIQIDLLDTYASLYDYGKESTSESAARSHDLEALQSFDAIRQQLESSWRPSRADFYELACYLTANPPRLRND